MKPALAALLGASFTAIACYAIGVLMLQWLGVALRRMERVPLAFTLGAACLHLTIFGVLAVHLAYWPVILAVMLGVIVLAILSGAWKSQGLETQRLGRPVQVLLGALGGAFFTVYLFNAWAPENSYDGAAYHLGLVARELRAHGFEYIDSNLYASLSQGIELLYLPAFAIGRHSAASLLHLCFAVVLAMLLLAFGRRLGKPWVGACAALLTCLSPVVGRVATAAYIDAATAAVAFAAFYWLEIWDREREPKSLIPAGLLVGYAIAAKYTTFPIALYAAGFLLYRTRRLRPVLVVAACAAIMLGPWIARNWMLYQNPIAPFGNAIFHNPNVHASFEAIYTENMQSYGVPSRWSLPAEVIFRGALTQGLLGPIFLLLPLGLFALRYPLGRRLWIVGVLMLLPFFGNVGTRFLIPSLPFLSLTLALALGERPVWLGLLMGLHAMTSWHNAVARYAAPNAWRIDKIPYRAALRLTDSDQYLRQTRPGFSIARMLEKYVPEGERVLTVAGYPDAYTNREILVGFQSAHNELLTDILYMGWIQGNQDRRTRIYPFAEKTGRRFRVTQIATGMDIDQWNVHEIRFFHQGKELPRQPEWRLQAWPNPWDVQLAFDNSPGTRWRSWEVPRPGMFIEVDFGSEKAIDEVRVETSIDAPAVRMQIETATASGTWQVIGERSHSTYSPPPESARRMATFELAARGIHYLVFSDTDFSAQDIREDPEAWGLTVVAEEPGVKLYKTIW